MAFQANANKCLICQAKQANSNSNSNSNSLSQTLSKAWGERKQGFRLDQGTETAWILCGCEYLLTSRGLNDMNA